MLCSYGSSSLVIVFQQKTASIIFWLTGCHMFNFCRAMLCISAAIAIMRCPSVCHVRGSWIMSKRIKIPSKFFHHWVAILVFPYQTGWRYSDGNPPNGVVECRWGIGTNRDSGLIAGYRILLDVRSAKNIYR